MKTFEERYTEWIDGELRGASLVSFEEELERRAQAGEAQAEKVGAASLRALLREHLEAPALSNTEFFNHQLRERIEREGHASRPTAPERPKAKASFWSFARFALPMSAAALFVGIALYYGTIPKQQPAGGPTLAVNHSSPASGARESARGDSSSELSAETVDETTSATPLKFKGPNNDQNVQVLWMNGLEYQPDEPAPVAAQAAP